MPLHIHYLGLCLFDQRGVNGAFPFRPLVNDDDRRARSKSEHGPRFLRVGKTRLCGLAATSRFHYIIVAMMRRVILMEVDLANS